MWPDFPAKGYGPWWGPGASSLAGVSRDFWFPCDAWHLGYCCWKAGGWADSCGVGGGDWAGEVGSVTRAG